MTNPSNTYALVPYSDGSGPRLLVERGIRLCEGEKTVKIAAVGGDVLVQIDDIDTLIAALKAAKRAADWEDTE